MFSMNDEFLVAVDVLLQLHCGPAVILIIVDGEFMLANIFA